MQEEVNQKVIALSVKTAKLTANVLKEDLNHHKNKKANTHGKTSVKKLVGQGYGASTIEINEGNIKSFEKVARKYNIDFAVNLEKKVVNIDHQLQRTCDMRYIIETTKTDAGTMKIPITEDVAQMFQAIIEDREQPKLEKVIDGCTRFLFYDDEGNPLVAMHWQHRFNRMVDRYNDIYRVQMPNITPHVCRHTYCSNIAKSGMKPKTLQYLMGHSDISVTMNVYTHVLRTCFG